MGVDIGVDNFTLDPGLLTLVKSLAQGNAAFEKFAVAVCVAGGCTRMHFESEQLFNLSDLAQPLLSAEVAALEWNRHFDAMDFRSLKLSRISELHDELTMLRTDIRGRFVIALAGHISNTGVHRVVTRTGITEAKLIRLVTSIRIPDLDFPQLESVVHACGVRLECSREIFHQFRLLQVLNGIGQRLSHEQFARQRAMKQARESQAEGRESINGNVTISQSARGLLHRSIASEVSLKPATPDYQGHCSKPDPLKARTEAELVDAMRQYRAWAGNFSLRDLESRCGGKLSHATFGNMLNGKNTTVPKKLSHIESFVTALGGNEEDQQRWATAWRHFRVPGPTVKTEGADESAKAGPKLRLTS